MSGEALGRSLGGFWCSGGVLEALGGSLDPFLKVLWLCFGKAKSIKNRSKFQLFFSIDFGMPF